MKNKKIKMILIRFNLIWMKWTMSKSKKIMNIFVKLLVNTLAKNYLKL